MAIVTDQNTAMAELKRLTEYSVEPVLDETNDLTPILNAAKTCDIWATGTAYSYGDEVVPTAANQNGRSYKCIKAGTSGSTEPFWSPYYGSFVVDGSSVWQECGAQPKSLWDMSAAAYNGWLAKAAKVSPDFDFSGAGESYKRSQVYEQCLKQAARFAPIKIA